ncbi:MAG: flagellar export protein FliJ [Candidatus Kryptoniota bacterium]
MAKFNFRLQSVIKVKEIQEKKVQRELAQLKKKILHEQAQLENLEGERDRAASTSPLTGNRENGNGKVRAADIVVHENYLRKISDEIHFENVKLDSLAQFETKKIDEVLDVKKDKETIERLKEKRLEEFRRDADRKEQILIDAVAQRLSA